MSEPSLENILGNLEGWRGQKSPQQDKAFEELAVIFATVFAGTAGQKVLNTILEMSLRRPICSSDKDYLMHRQGQNDLALAILTYVKSGMEISNDRYEQRAASTRPTEFTAEYTGSGQYARFE